MSKIREIEVNGAIKRKGNTFMLTIYSSPFARYLISSGIKEVNLEFCQNKIFLSEGNMKNLIFERVKEDHPLTLLYIGKLIPEKLRGKVIENKKQLPIKINAVGFISEDELIKYNRGITRAEPKKYTLTTSKNQLLKIGCFISIYIQNRKKNYKIKIIKHIL